MVNEKDELDELDAVRVEVALISASYMQQPTDDGETQAVNLMITAIIFGYRAHVRGWTIERTIAEGQNL